MMKKAIQLVFIFLICVSNQVSFSQNLGESNFVGKNYSLKSEELDEERGIQIYLPKAYNEGSERSFPVLYVLDGQEYFLHGIAYQDMLYFRDKSPGFIIVGINTDRRKRRQLFHSESEKFTAFLREELVPFIDSSYRTKKDKERLFFGWEMAGGLGLEILVKQRNLFSGFILASPTHATESRVEALRKFYKVNTDDNTFILVTAAPEEHWIKDDSTFLSVIGEGKNTRFTVLDREDHYTTPLKTIHEGLSDYFADYKPIRLRSIEAYDDYGGLDALVAYYKKRGERYGLSQDIHKETKHFLLYNAMQENNYERFLMYVKALDGYIETNTRDIWFSRYAKFYLKHGNEKEALRIYSFALNKLTKSTLLFEGLGDLYSSQGNKRKAKSNYEKALLINSELDSVKKKLEKLN